jgi:ACS family glucarate transporter-like MFS transporter
MKQKFPYRYRVLFFLFTLLFITYLDRISIGLVGKRIMSEFHLTNVQFGWVLSAFSLAYALFEIPSGIMGDRKGQKVVLTRIVLWWSLFTALTGVTTGFMSLIIVRFLFGMGEAGALPTTSGVLSRWFPANELSRGISASLVGQIAGAAIAPFIVVPLAMAFGWRTTFFVNGFIGLLWVIVCVLWFRNNPSEMKGITAEEKKFIEKNRCFTSHSQNISWKKILGSRSLRALVSSFFCSQWGMYFFIAWMPIYLQQGRHFSETNMKFITSLIFIPAIAACLAIGVFSDWLVKKRGLKFGRRFIGMLSLGINSILFLVEATTLNNTVLVGCFIAGFACQLILGVAAFGVCIDIGGNHAGTVAGVMNCIGQMGAFFLAIVFGKIVDTTHSFNAPLFVISGLLFIGSLLWLLVDPTKKLILENNGIQIKEATFS